MTVVCILAAVLAVGCTSPGQGPVTPKPGHPAPVFSPGDVLSGNMTLAGYDTPDPKAGQYQAVVLAYQPGPDMYVYTFVMPLTNGSYQYVLPDQWEAKFGRPRTEFEGYGLVKNGTMAPGQLRAVT